MRVHVVTEDHGDPNHVLTRLMTALDSPLFTFGQSPDPTADLNYYGVYLTWKNHRDFTATPTAAYFTHLDRANPTKRAWWEGAAEAVDLRICSASHFEDILKPYGLTRRILPPLDRQKFNLPAEPRRWSHTPVIGTSGFVYPGKRKGRDLWHLARQQRPGWSFVSSGKGWDNATKFHPWEKMQDFYHTLDVYLCTSLNEGIGYGPLEALACGVPVVLPRGVGVFDDLPELENLYRYEAGQVDSMIDALDTAVRMLQHGGINTTSLRGATARFSGQNWTEQHVLAAEYLLYDTEPIRSIKDWHQSAVMVTVAYGGPARLCAQTLLKSWHLFMPDVKSVLISDEPLGIEDIFVNHPDSDIGARGPKLKIDSLVPGEYEFILYLDADTELVDPVDFLFDLLHKGWEMAWCRNPPKYESGLSGGRPDNQDELKETIDQIGTGEFLQINGGVCSYRRNERTIKFFKDWYNEWDRYGKRDQMALSRVLYRNPLRVCVLGVEWNTSDRYIEVERSAGIVHHQTKARRWQGLIQGRNDSPEAWKMVHPDWEVFK